MKYLIIILPILFACAEKSSFEQKPDDLMTEVQMKEVLKEMILIESHLQATQPSIESVQKAMQLNGKEILANHKIGAEQFEKSMEYYSAHQEELSKIYEKIIDELKVEQVKNE